MMRVGRADPRESSVATVDVLFSRTGLWVIKSRRSRAEEAGRSGQEMDRRGGRGFHMDYCCCLIVQAEWPEGRTSARQHPAICVYVVTLFHICRCIVAIFEARAICDMWFPLCCRSAYTRSRGLWCDCRPCDGHVMWWGRNQVSGSLMYCWQTQKDLGLFLSVLVLLGATSGRPDRRKRQPIKRPLSRRCVCGALFSVYFLLHVSAVFDHGIYCVGVHLCLCELRSVFPEVLVMLNSFPYCWRVCVCVLPCHFETRIKR